MTISINRKMIIDKICYKTKSYNNNFISMIYVKMTKEKRSAGTSTYDLPIIF